MDEEFDINIEYEKLHGSISRKMLFDEEEYNILRRQIIESSKSELNTLYTDSKSLNKPQLLKRRFLKASLFDGVRLIPYHEWRLIQEIKEAKKAGRHLYYLKKEEKGQLVVYAVGFYDKKQDGGFVVLEYSFSIDEFNKTNHLCNYNFYRENGIVYEKHRHRYESASVAARCYLGREASFADWIDDNGISLASDRAYKEPSLKPLETSNIRKVLREINGKNTQDRQFKLPKKEQSVQCEIDFRDAITTKETKTNSNSHEVFTDPHPHTFRLLLGECNASGYFLPDDGIFYVCAGSIVDEGLEITPKRQRFLDKSCKKTADGWKVIKDTKCISATAAARYVTGREVDYTLWRDSNGKYLKDYYPKYFFIGGKTDNTTKKQTTSNEDTSVATKPIIRWGAHTFYLRTETGESDLYDAKGFYDPKTGLFTIKEGGLLSLTVKSTKFDQSSLGRLRVSIIKENCSREKKGYRLKTNVVFKDPIYAASIVIGKTVNGWNLWKDNKGFFLSAYVL